MSRMSEPLRTPSFTDVAQAAFDFRLQNVHVALPARVERFDSDKQVADVQPLLLVPLIDEDGTETTERLPVIPNVPVIFPRGSGFHLVFPLAVGDNVMVVFCERSLDLWKSRGGEVNPVEQTMHSLKGAVCYPGLYPNTSPVPSFPSNKLVVGKDGVAHKPAARKDDGVGSGTISLVGVAGVGPLAGALAGVTLIYTPGFGGGPQTSIVTPASPTGANVTISEKITGGSGNVEIAD